jgi:hypothetical protein
MAIAGPDAVVIASRGAQMGHHSKFPAAEALQRSAAAAIELAGLPGQHAPLSSAEGMFFCQQELERDDRYGRAASPASNQGLLRRAVGKGDICRGKSSLSVLGRAICRTMDRDGRAARSGTDVGCVAEDELDFV